MSERVAEEYIQLLGRDKKAQMALLACSAAYRLNDNIAREAIELMAESNGSTGILLGRIKRLGCVLKQDDEFWCIAEDVRPHLVDRLYQQVGESTALSRLRGRLAEHAEALARRQVATHRVYQARFEAAIHRLQLPELAKDGAQQLADLWQQHYPGPLAEAAADSVEYLVPEIKRHHQTLPAEVLFMRGMAARAIGNRRAEEDYFGQVYRRGHRGRIYALAAFFYALVVRNRRTAEEALTKCIEWDDSVKNLVIAYHERGRLRSRFRHRWREAEADYNKSLEIDPDSRSQAQTLHSLADLLTEQERWQEAKEAYDKSLERRRDKSHQGQVYDSLGKLFHKQGRWKESRKAYNKSLRLLTDRSHQGRVYHSLGNLLSEQPEHWAEAEKNYNDSLRHLDKRSDKGQVLHSRGKLLAKQKRRWADAESDFWLSIELRDNPVDKAYVFHSLGNLLSKKPDRWRDAEEAYKQSVELRDHPEDQVHVLASWAKLLSKFADEQDFQRAEKFTKDKITAAKDNKSQKVYYKFLADINRINLIKPKSLRLLQKDKRRKKSDDISQTKRKT